MFFSGNVCFSAKIIIQVVIFFSDFILFFFIFCSLFFLFFIFLTQMFSFLTHCFSSLIYKQYLQHVADNSLKTNKQITEDWKRPDHDLCFQRNLSITWLIFLLITSLEDPRRNFWYNVKCYQNKKINNQRKLKNLTQM